MTDNLTPFERHLHDSRRKERDRKADWHQPGHRRGEWSVHQQLVLEKMIEQQKHSGLAIAEGEAK